MVLLRLPGGRAITATPEPVPTPDEEWISAEGDRLASCQEVRAHTDTIWVTFVSEDGSAALSASRDETTKLWSLPEGAEVKTLKGLKGRHIEALAVMPDGTLLASGSNDGTIKLWSLPEGGFASCLIDLAANESDVEGVTYRLEGESGELLEYTLPCGSPIPPGAVCVCNCVGGGYVPPCSCVGHSGGGGHYWYHC